MIKHVIILAAGGGGRMLPLTLEIPKAMVPCRGKPLIKYPLDLFEKIENRYVTIGHLKEVLRAYLDGKVSDVINTEGKGNAWFLLIIPLFFLFFSYKTLKKMIFYRDIRLIIYYPIYLLSYSAAISIGFSKRFFRKIFKFS